MKQCLGCGSPLQIDNENERGYARSTDHDYCQSCFRLRHYRDFKRVKAKVDDGATLEFIQEFQGHVIWVLDIMHLNQSLHRGLLRSLRDKSVVLLVNKRDLLSQAVSDGKLKQNIMRQLKGERIELSDIIFASSLKPKSLSALKPYIEDAPCAFVGCVNAGKSSVLNALLGKDDLSVSPVASTTADVMKISAEDYEVYDTPGLSTETLLTEKFSDETLVLLSPHKTIKPQVFQIYEKQSLVIGNLGAITIDPVKTVNIISYLPFDLKRVKPERMEANLELEHEFMINSPEYRNRKWPHTDTMIDIEIFDVGFISIQGECKSIDTRLDKTAEAVYRKALI